MPITLEEVKERVRKNKDTAWQMLTCFVRGDYKLEQCGYKSLEDAFTKIITSTNKDNEKLLRQYEKENPD